MSRARISRPHFAGLTTPCYRRSEKGATRCVLHDAMGGATTEPEDGRARLIPVLERGLLPTEPEGAELPR